MYLGLLAMGTPMQEGGKPPPAPDPHQMQDAAAPLLPFRLLMFY
jgi:hypothetical protein